MSQPVTSVNASVLSLRKDPLADIREYLNAREYFPPELVADGQFKRFDYQGSKKSGFCIVWQNVGHKSGQTYVTCLYGNWKTGEKSIYHPQAIPSAEKTYIKSQVRYKMKIEEQERSKEHLETAKVAEIAFHGFAESGSTEYMRRKGIDCLDGCRIEGQMIAVPCRDIDGKFWGYQRVYDDGGKYFLNHQKVIGCFHTIGKPLYLAKKVFICEGWATGASIHMATKETVIVAFDCGNLPQVTQQIVEKYPLLSITICGDDDRFEKKTGLLREDNPGRKRATEAACIAKGALTFPQFQPEDKFLTDFNDAHLKYGIDAIRNQLVKRTVAENPDLTQVEIEEHIFLALTKDEKSVLPHTSFTLATYENQRGIQEAIEIKAGGLCEKIPLIEVKRFIAKYTRNELKGCLTYQLTDRKAGYARDYWSNNVHPIPKPNLILLEDEPGLTFWRCPKIDSTMKAPIFDEFLSRIASEEQKMVLQAFIGSIFIRESYNQQYLILKGDGNDSKGAFTRALQRYLSPISVALNKIPQENNKHWAMPFFDKRLAIFTDIKKFDATNECIKSLIGGDQLQADPKGRDEFNFQPICKVIVCTNNDPHLSILAAEQRRVLLVKITTTTDFRATYEDEFLAEMPGILARGIAMHHLACPQKEPIKVDSETRHELMSIGEGDCDAFELTFSRGFQDVEDAKLKPLEMQNHLTLRYGANDRKSIKDFKEWLSRYKNGKYKKIYPRVKEGERIWYHPHLETKAWSSNV